MWAESDRTNDLETEKYCRRLAERYLTAITNTEAKPKYYVGDYIHIDVIDGFKEGKHKIIIECEVHDVIKGVGQLLADEHLLGQNIGKILAILREPKQWEKEFCNKHNITLITAKEMIEEIDSKLNKQKKE